MTLIDMDARHRHPSIHPPRDIARVSQSICLSVCGPHEPHVENTYRERAGEWMDTPAATQRHRSSGIMTDTRQTMTDRHAAPP
mmetsp:Transcript_44005/g.109735  ORF Transcript_44005/g.109735 Transcript_44005/m.109735 type:complete len:83 (+) Transcript_44005:160-408(+)